ncbi:MAG: carboxypeptidase regulatory-like domain-containing protein, partial [bacterium]|nr:carboxypeptidase regulatory-like domain-containing protein [bacterium]
MIREPFARPVLRVIVLGFVAGFLAIAQVDTATITGIVTDPSGASIVGAELKATNTATGLDYQASSNETGAYVIVAVPIGAYELEATSPGVQTI